MQLHFYDVAPDYAVYLQEEERKVRGYTKVPNLIYDEGHEPKLVCGIVLEINGYKYYVPVSSYKIQQSNNILIRLNDDKYNQVKGSLRFNYMFPIADGCATIRDFSKEAKLSRKIFLHRQLVYCDSIRDEIYDMAQQTYKDVIKGENKELINNACDFKLLELAADRYRERRIQTK